MKVNTSRQRDLSGSVSSDGDLDQDLEGIELEVIPESPKNARPEPIDWETNRTSSSELEVTIIFPLPN